ENDFTSYRDRLPKLRQIMTPSDQAALALVRLEAQGLLELGQPLDSFDVCLEMFSQVQRMSDHPLQVASGYQLDPSRWIRAQLGEIWDAASADERTTIDEQLANFIA